MFLGGCAFLMSEVPLYYQRERERGGGRGRRPRGASSVLAMSERGTPRSLFRNRERERERERKRERKREREGEALLGFRVGEKPVRSMATAASAGAEQKLCLRTKQTLYFRTKQTLSIQLYAMLSIFLFISIRCWQPAPGQRRHFAQEPSRHFA